MLTSSNIHVVSLKESGFKLWQQGRRTFHESTIADVPAGLPSGASVDIKLPNGNLGGRGYFNGLSKIPLRLLTYNNEIIDINFWLNQFKIALGFRLDFYPEEDSFRLIFGDSDKIPGLIVDKFGNYLVIQITTAGIERHSENILAALDILFEPHGIVLACDSLPRKKEGLELYRIQVKGEPLYHPVQAKVDGVQYLIDILHGHKTGFFLDHRKNREFAAKLCKGKNVLDMFCFSGAFAIAASLQHADHVTAIDIHEPSIALGRKSAELNGVSDKLEFVRAEAFDFLASTDTKWDLVFLDPPSFVRGNKRARRNLFNYRKINRLALNIVSPGGILVTSCCSFHVSREDYMGVLESALQQAGCSGKIFHVGCQSPDHPIIPGADGTDYLKCFFLKKDL
ncbi:class I SAM-dependent rRNA methyltransferase [bacterium]|nr:class I SAM-dependent rRNA methyltransferase [bacterium]